MAPTPTTSRLGSIRSKPTGKQRSEGADAPAGSGRGTGTPTSPTRRTRSSTPSATPSKGGEATEGGPTTEPTTTTTTGGEGGDGSTGTGRGRRGNFAPRLNAARGSGGKGKKASKEPAAEDVSLPSGVEKLVREARAATRGGGKGSVDPSMPIKRGARIAAPGDSDRVMIGGGAAPAPASKKAAASKAVAAAATTEVTLPSSKTKKDAKDEPMDVDDDDKSDSESGSDAKDTAMDVGTAPTRQVRMSRQKQAALAMENAARQVQPQRATTENMYDAEQDWTDKDQYYPTVLTTSSREVETSSVGDAIRDTNGEDYVVFQLPSDLPLRNKSASDQMEVDGVIDLGDDLKPQDCVRKVSELSDGQLGELKIHADGSVKLCIGNAIFDVTQGTPYQHAEQLARLDEDLEQCVILGKSTTRVTCIPDVTHLLL